ncbi:DNA topoisomerase IV subunit A [Arboricoccus pini]|uniref:DNA topoisomerase 4 subunit A n=1 Tax=Arboricoccus pini TaxID=1963835 RepID=A0A212QPI1_9PROT|nr:DNA topoisomerase IV subunit A [Arboricoccus pini]SNB61308.1 DNA topoisomerase IV subunit A [Arboricoccus pini]
MSRAANAGSGGPEGGDIRPVNLKDALSERYLAYALSTITSRSLPDVRDGLKPVQRRLLYAMRELRLDPASGYKKCARVVGDVIGKFHPHGDTAVYDAMVRLAQSFAQRYPLVDGQGNFGNIDGDNPAAMRYTEARLTDVAMALLEGIDENAVDFRDTYDGSETEPVVLPAAFPNLLANGAAGIAVGMATNIPPHNAGELLDALAWMLKRKAGELPSVEELMAHIKGPDLPTGGVLIDSPELIAAAYRTGRGSLRLRAKWEREELPHGLYQVVITEIPYLVQKSRLLERLAELFAAKKLPLLQDLRDESADTVRLILVPRARTIPADALMEQVFKASELEVRLSLNMNVLDAQGVPRVMGIAEILQSFLDHRMVVLIRRTEFRLGKIADRLEVLEGYLKAFLDLDRVIQIIREEDEPKAALIAAFELTDRQAEAILNLRLRNLRRLEEMELQGEAKKLRDEQADLQALLADEGLRRGRLREQILATKKAFGSGELGRRRTELGSAPTVSAEIIDLPVERFPVTVVLSAKGWIRAMRGHLEASAEVKYKEGDGERFLLHSQTSDKLLLLTTDGKVFTIGVDRLPGGRGQGEPLTLFVDIARGVEIVAARIHEPEGRLILATKDGRGFQAVEKELLAQTKTGRQVVNLDQGLKLDFAVPVRGDMVAVTATNHKLLVFPLEELPIMARGKGVLIMRMKDGELADIKTFQADEGLTFGPPGQTRRVNDLQGYMGKRAGSGRLAPRGFPRHHRFE